jgi:hypothetical protein
MGLLSRTHKEAAEPVAGGADDFFVDTVLGIGVLVDGRPTMRIVPDNMPGTGNRYYKLNVLVKLENTEPYQAEFTEPIAEPWWIELVKDPAKPFAVRVAKTDRQKVRIAFDVDPKNVSVSRGSAADILASGLPARAIIVENEELQPPKLSKLGYPIYRFLLTVMLDGKDPYRVNVGNGVPPSALPFLFPGSNVPAKVDPDSSNGVVIDWDQATAEAAAKA